MSTCRPAVALRGGGSSAAPTHSAQIWGESRFPQRVTATSRIAERCLWVEPWGTCARRVPKTVAAGFELQKCCSWRGWWRVGGRGCVLASVGATVGDGLSGVCRTLTWGPSAAGVVLCLPETPLVSSSGLCGARPLPLPRPPLCSSPPGDALPSCPGPTSHLWGWSPSWVSLCLLVMVAVQRTCWSVCPSLAGDLLTGCGDVVPSGRDGHLAHGPAAP